MIKYATLIDSENGLCAIGMGNDYETYIKMGMVRLNVEQSDIDGQWYLVGKCPKKSNNEKIKDRESEFNSAFFYTSLGYVRREVTMANGTTKDFLSDLLPIIKTTIESGKNFTIITYLQPDFSKELTTEYIESLQNRVVPTLQFIEECSMQLAKDFDSNFLIK